MLYSYVTIIFQSGGAMKKGQTVEEQIVAMFLVKWHRIGVTQPGGFYSGSNQHPAIEEVGSR